MLIFNEASNLTYVSCIKSVLLFLLMLVQSAKQLENIKGFTSTWCMMRIQKSITNRMGRKSRVNVTWGMLLFFTDFKYSCSSVYLTILNLCAVNGEIAGVGRDKLTETHKTKIILYMSVTGLNTFHLSLIWNIIDAKIFSTLNVHNSHQSQVQALKLPTLNAFLELRSGYLTFFIYT